MFVYSLISCDEIRSAHLLRLGEHLEIPAQARGDATVSRSSVTCPSRSAQAIGVRG
jgi:hypothetical protein